MAARTKVRRKRKPRKNESAAVRLYRQWHQRNPRSVRRVRMPEVGEEVVLLGEVREIIYFSDKWGERAEYIHRFKGKAKLVSNAEGDLLCIFGKGVRVTPDGIEG